MIVACTLYIHNMFTIYTPCVLNMFNTFFDMICSPHSYHMFIVCILFIHSMLTVCTLYNKMYPILLLNFEKPGALMPLCVIPYPGRRGGGGTRM